jgi:hypothetical protein
VGVSAQEHDVKDDGGEATFDRAKLPMILAAVGVTGGLAIAGSVERTAGGAIVLGAWVVGIIALHRLGRAGSRPQASGLRPQARDEKASESASEPEPETEPEDEPESEPAPESEDEPESEPAPESEDEPASEAAKKRG